MNLNGWRSGQQPRPRIQTIAQRAPAVAPQKHHGGREDNFSTDSIGQARREPRDRPKIQRKSQDFDSCIGVADPCVAFKGLIRQKKIEAVGGEDATMHAVALICSPRYL